MEHPIWIHAVSVGETAVAAKLIREIQARSPGVQIVLSTTTTTAQEVARNTLPDSADIAVIYNPVDFPPTVERALHLIRPSLIVLVEAEVWPNLCALARRRHIPLALVNARMSPRSQRRYERARFFVEPIFALLAQVCVQESADIVRFVGAGMRRESIRHTGSVKFDPPSAPSTDAVLTFRELLLPLLPAGEGSPVLLAASTFPGEEKLVAESFLILRRHIPNLFLMVAPRHSERTIEALDDLQQLGLQVALRSQLPTVRDTFESTSRPDCLLIDSTGELVHWQALATVVVIGKSFLAEGGQNPAEAASLGIPTVVGPHMQNFQALVTRMLAFGGTIQIDPSTELTPTLSKLFTNEHVRQKISEAASSALEPHRGATSRTVDSLLELLPSSRNPAAHAES